MMPYEPIPPLPPAGFLDRLRYAGIEPGDGPDVQLTKSLLMLATGLVTFVMMIWVGVYHFMGQHFSANLPLVFQALLVANMILYIKSRNFEFFRISQLGLFLFLPFVAQWIAGNFIVSSGVVLWGILAPVGAIMCFGARESMGWFVAWVVLTGLSAAADFYLADPFFLPKSGVPIRVSLVFFALNFIAVAAITYTLLLFSLEQKRKIQERLEESRKKVAIAQSAADSIFFRPLL